MDEIREAIKGEMGRLHKDLAVLMADECLVRPGQVKLLLSVGEVTAQEFRKLPSFPKLREVRPGTFAYLKSEIVAWMRETPVSEKCKVIGDRNAAI